MKEFFVDVKAYTLAKPLNCKGTFQKLLSGFCPLRGGVPPIPIGNIPLKSRFFRSKKSIFCLFHTFLALFGLLYGKMIFRYVSQSVIGGHWRSLIRLIRLDLQWRGRL